MISGTHVGTNFRFFGHGTLPPLALIVLVLLPLVFGGLFVWAYYDPIGNLNQMPVALVNSDEGDAGDEVVDQLLERRPLDFHVVSAEEARDGVADGTYYMGIEIPTDFTEAATSVATPTPHQAKLNVSLNETNGFLPTILGNQVATIMTSAVGTTISTEVANQLFIGFNTAGEGLDQAAEGAEKLDEGVGGAKDGSEALSTGAGAADAGAHALSGGLGALSEGAQKLDEGVGALEQGANKLYEGIGAAKTGADVLSDGMLKLQGGTDALGSGADLVAGGVDQIASVAPQLGQAQAIYGEVTAAVDHVVEQLEAAPLPGTEQLAAKAREVQSKLRTGALAKAMSGDTLAQLVTLQAGAHEIARQLGDPQAPYRAGLDQAVAGAQALAKGLSMLQDGSGVLVAGVSTLKDGSSALVVGARAAADGSSKLAAGTDQLVVGAKALSEGLVLIDGGTGELSMRLGEGASEAPRFDDELRDAAATAAGTPVTPNLVADSVTYFGKGLSPFFLSLALWFGGLTMFMVMKPMSRRAVDSGTNPVRALFATLLPAFLVGLAQAATLWLVQVAAIHVEPAHPALLFGMLWFVSWVFLTFITMLNVVFGPAAGRLITMALMSVQLVASNGLYPNEVQPRPIQWLHEVDPMRFSVDLLRFSLFGARDGDPRLVTGIVVLATAALVAGAIAALGLWIQRVIPRKDIHPELSL